MLIVLLSIKFKPFKSVFKNLLTMVCQSHLQFLFACEVFYFRMMTLVYKMFIVKSIIVYCESSFAYMLFVLSCNTKNKNKRYK